MIKSKIKIGLMPLVLLSSMVFSQGFGVSSKPTDDHEKSVSATLKKLLSQSSKPGSTHLPASSQEMAKSSQNLEPVQINHSQEALSSAGDLAFSRAARSIMPLSPEQIKTLRYMLDESQRAAATYPGPPPRPTSSSVVVNLSPGATPPIVRMRAGYVAALNFLDSTGVPWPIVAYDLGDPKSFNIQWDHKGNTLLAQAMTSYKSGNLAVVLKGLSVPVMVTLIPGQHNVDYRVDLRIPGLGPNAKPETSRLPLTSNPALIHFLDGVPAQNARTLSVSGDHYQSQAWLYQDHLYLRTRATVLSPAWLSSMSSPDGTHIYELPIAPVVLVSDEGSMLQLIIKGL